MKTRSRKREKARSSSTRSSKKKQTKRQSELKSLAGQNVQNKPQLPVTCGCKKGMLNLKKYANVKKCVLSEGVWFTLTGFERFGMKERNKKWRWSILCYGIPLQKLIEDGFLSSTNLKKNIYQRKRSLRKKNNPQKTKRPEALQQQESDESIDGDEDEDASGEDVEDADHVEDADVTNGDVTNGEDVADVADGDDADVADGDVADGDDADVADGDDADVANGDVADVDDVANGDVANGDVADGEDADGENADYADATVDMSVFDAPTLPVTCGSASGLLHKNRFAGGCCGRCVRTEKSWMTPEDFIRSSKPDGTWRKDILSHGLPLGKLIIKTVLKLHTVNCDCDICLDPDQNQRNDDVCFVCDSEGDLVCCDECPRAFHPDCHLPAVDVDSMGSEWSCTFCAVKKMNGSSPKTQQDVLSSPVSQYTLHCQCLLLHLLCENRNNSSSNDPEYICGPIMLGRVKCNLSNNDYETVQEFVADIEYVFHHYTSNRDNDFSRMTSRLKELIESIFKPL